MRRRAGFRRDRSGAVALEFAIVGTVFCVMLLFVVELGLRLYAQAALDYATTRSARMLATDPTQSLSRTRQGFQTVSFCPLLAAFMDCRGVAIGLRPVTDFLAASPAGGANPAFAPGQGGSLMLLSARYTLPADGVWPGGDVVTANAPYQNEY